MKPQIIVIAGGPGSGKTSMTKIIAGNRKTVWLDGIRDKDFLSNTLLYNNVTELTECIVAEDIKVKMLKKYLLTLFDDYLLVRRQYKDELVIKRPTVIITCTCELLFFNILKNTNPYRNRVSFIYLDKAAIAPCPIID